MFSGYFLQGLMAWPSSEKTDTHTHAYTHTQTHTDTYRHITTQTADSSYLMSYTILLQWKL